MTIALSKESMAMIATSGKGQEFSDAVVAQLERLAGDLKRDMASHPSAQVPHVRAAITAVLSRGK